MMALARSAAALAMCCGVAAANGRPPATSTITFQRGNAQHIVAGMTFGALLSDDGGATWRWMCEDAIGYGGIYDPDYAYSASGTVFATTFAGFKAMRGDCRFGCAHPPCACSTTKATACSYDADCPTGEQCSSVFASHIEIGPNGTVYFAAADSVDAKIYRSTDDGASFQSIASPGQNNDWWESLIVAPSDPMRIYLSGYRLAGGNPKTFLLFRSSDGGANFTAMSTAGLATSNNSAIAIVAVDPANADVIYVHVTFDMGGAGDSIYKSADAGATWNKILSKQDPFGMAFLVRSNGDLIAATQTTGTVKSTAGAGCNNPITCAWQDLPSPPHINCLVNNPATVTTTHEIWACTHNYDSPGIPGDGYGIMKTTDLVTWQPVLRYSDIAGPVECSPGTPQHDQCAESYMGKPSVWCCLEQQLGIASAFDCTGARSCDPQGDSGPPVNKASGCCSASSSGAGFLLLGTGTAALWWRRPRRRTQS